MDTRTLDTRDALRSALAQGHPPDLTTLRTAPAHELAEAMAELSPTELGLLFTRGEREAADRAREPHRHYAVCFAAKEAVGKALGVGLGGIDWPDVETVIEGPSLRLRLETVTRP